MSKAVTVICPWVMSVQHNVSLLKLNTEQNAWLHNRYRPGGVYLLSPVPASVTVVGIVVSGPLPVMALSAFGLSGSPHRRAAMPAAGGPSAPSVK